jgi:uncharacterized membrane-anchored protein YitT (DUF2179 family)
MHEMDAVRCKEWRIFPLLSLLNDDWGFKVFMFAHIPLFYFIFLKLSDESAHQNLIFGLNIFFIIHFFLHLLFLKHPKNEFKDATSWGIISGCGLFGLLSLIV